MTFVTSELKVILKVWNGNPNVGLNISTWFIWSQQDQNGNANPTTIKGKPMEYQVITWHFW